MHIILGVIKTFHIQVIEDAQKIEQFALGCNLSSPSSGYSSNRLVRESDLRRPGGTFTLKNNTSYPYKLRESTRVPFFICVELNYS